LKFLVAEREQRMALEALGIDLHAADSCQVYYLDTPDLTLLAHGVVLRVRRGLQGGHDAAVKLRPVVPAEIPRKWRGGDDVSLELDAAPRSSLCAATFKRTPSRKRLEASLSGDRPLQRLFSKRQRRLLADSGLGAIDWSTLRVFGPAEVGKVKTAVHPAGLRLVAELWRYPDGSSLLELSTRVKPRELRHESRRLWAFLAGLGLDVAADQQTKTEHTLTFFAASPPPGVLACEPQVR
jgi:hypothetical protein